MTALLLDTHVLIWTISRPERLGRKVALAIERAANGGSLLVSAATFGEIATLVAKRRIKLKLSPAELRNRCLRSGAQEVAVTGEQAIDAAGLEGLPGDPIDRFIVAAARHRGATLVTADTQILGWKGQVARLDATT